MTTQGPTVMTKAQFVKGWKLLIIQPWGARYNRAENGQPTEESRTQLEFYYDKLKWADPRAWMKLASTYAEGKEWPSIGELKTSLQVVNARYVPAINDKRAMRDGESMPSEVRDMISRIARPMADIKRLHS
jgi:hypothetical protein